ncbi:DUF202 domain-containing protein [Corynebacterium sp.]|uniref:DUF202 domain-containing protein n=1 Tax=Corynebacterium sp. TaxID=1720 RepID=UPI002649D79E|nr:DUF202 domain-containing protein [Corynebacterium sp.]
MVRDPGLQPERTNLSWSRTAMRLMLTATAMLHWVSSYGRPVVLVAGLLAYVGLVIYMTQVRRYRRQFLGMGRASIAPSVLGVVTLTVSTVVLGLVSLVLVIIGAL